MRRDLLLLICLIALVACLKPAAGPVDEPEDMLPEVHGPWCIRPRPARVEYRNGQSPVQEAEIERGEVVYLALRYGGKLIPECRPDLDSGKAICIDDDFQPTPIAGQSWYCKGCRASWGRHLPSLRRLLY